MKRFYRIVLFLGAAALILDGWALVDFLLHPQAGDATFGSSLFRAATVLIPLPLTVLVGFLILRRVPGNVVGPLLFVWSGTVAYNSIREDIGPVLFGLFYGYNILFGWLGLFLTILHFPDGRITPPRAARWVYFLLGLMFPVTCLVLISQRVYDIPSPLPNSFFVPSMAGVEGFVNGSGVLLFAPLLLLTLAAPVLRYHKGALLEQQQIKWLALFGGLTVAYTLVGLILYPLLTGGPIMSPGSGLFAMLFYFGTGLFPPLAIGMAVLRYRLWDIDLLIRRTLVYSVLTLLLTLIYFGSVVLLQNLFFLAFRLTTGDLAIVLSTLAIAVLFTPLRRRVQSAIDRRFFRRRYDADQILSRFAATARGVVSIEPLADALMQHVEETLQTEGTSLWLKK